MHFVVCDIVYPLISHQHVSAAIRVNFRLMLLSKE